MSSQFGEAAAQIKAEGKNLGLNNDQLLQLYGLYKQATVGDNNDAQPSFYQLEAKSKWNAWNGRKGLSKEQAETQYIALVNSLLKKWLPVYPI